jgi:pimeloyl-ACP methyl ester carboxylesterase
VAEPGDGTGAATRGSTVLLVPGYTGSKEDFRLLLEPLAAAGHRVVALDQRGQFQSPGGPELESYTTTALAEDVLAVADELGPSTWSATASAAWSAGLRCSPGRRRSARWC